MMTALSPSVQEPTMTPSDPPAQPSPQNAAHAAHRIPFRHFYPEVYLPEHRHPLNVGLHVLGTVAGLAFAVWAGAAGPAWWLLLFPLVHAAPGLIGHRLVERNAAVGDVRVTRTDFPPWWFIAANHRLTWDVLRGRWRA
jgi:hypothetical protein